jgi:hypothetical protein
MQVTLTSLSSNKESLVKVLRALKAHLKEESVGDSL